MAVSTLFRKIGDGYTYYKFYTPTPLGTTPYGEPTMAAIIADNQTFGGTDVSGLEVAITREVIEDKISQEIAAIQKLITGESATLKITIEAGKLDNLAIASGGKPGDITNVVAGSTPRAVYAAKSYLVGGDATLEFFAILHEVCNSVSPNLKEYIYAPNCQTSEGFGWSFKQAEIRKLELSINVLPARQDGFLITGGCSRHALMQVLFEYT